jgi:hypothetical protein
MSRLPRPPRVITPMWIIFLFFAFTEVVLGLAVFKTTGGIQVALTIFVMGFPLLVAAAFFYLLIYRPENIFSPGEFRSDAGYIESRTIAYGSRSLSTQEDLNTKIEQEITQRLTSGQFAKRISPLQGEELTEALEDTAVTLSKEIRETNFFTVCLDRIAPDLNDLTMPIAAFTTFHGLLDEIYFRLRSLHSEGAVPEVAVPPRTYGTHWVLRNKETGEVFKSIWMLEDVGSRDPLVSDHRSLQEVGIKPGMTLEIVRLD